VRASLYPTRSILLDQAIALMNPNDGSIHYERAARVWNARGENVSRKVSERMTLYLEGKTPVSVMFFPQGGNCTGRDVKYIGMDVHKEAPAIAVLNDSGKPVMESIVETKASSILPVYPRSAGRVACDLGRRDLGGLAVRSAAAPSRTACIELTKRYQQSSCQLPSWRGGSAVQANLLASQQPVQVPFHRKRRQHAGSGRPVGKLFHCRIHEFVESHSGARLLETS